MLVSTLCKSLKNQPVSTLPLLNSELKKSCIGLSIFAAWHVVPVPCRKQGNQTWRRMTMKNKVKAIPDGFHAVTPYLTVRGAASAIDFYKRAFGATEILRMPGPDGKIMHAEIT